MEKFFANILAPKILSNKGRTIILIAYAIFTTIEMYGVVNVERDFSAEYFLPKGTITDNYLQMDLKYFRTGFFTDLIVENPLIDYSSEEI